MPGIRRWRPQARLRDRLPFPASSCGGLLRERIGFRGVVVSDDLGMGGMLAGRSIGEAAVAAVEAGCDLLPVCRSAESIRAAHRALVERASQEAGLRRAGSRSCPARRGAPAAATESCDRTPAPGLGAIEPGYPAPPRARGGHGDAGRRHAPLRGGFGASPARPPATAGRWRHSTRGRTPARSQRP